MKRFLLFFGSRYYPSGGWDDFQGSYGSPEEAIAAMTAKETGVYGGWWHVVDIEQRQIVASGKVEDEWKFDSTEFLKVHYTTDT